MMRRPQYVEKPVFQQITQWLEELKLLDIPSPKHKNKGRLVRKS
jgi:hypothetical protein